MCRCRGTGGSTRRRRRRRRSRLHSSAAAAPGALPTPSRTRLATPTSSPQDAASGRDPGLGTPRRASAKSPGLRTSEWGQENEDWGGGLAPMGGSHCTKQNKKNTKTDTHRRPPFSLFFFVCFNGVRTYVWHNVVFLRILSSLF